MFVLLAECAQVLVPDPSPEALQFYRSGMILWAIQQFWSLFLPCLFLITGFSGRLAHFSKNIGKKWYFSIAIYLVIFILLYQLLSLPLDFYASYIRPHSYKISTQSLTTWLDHYGKGLLVLIFSALTFVWIFYLFLKKSPKRWWIYGSLTGSVILFFFTTIEPIWIDPLFSHFGPMKNEALEQQILDLAAKAGIEGSRVFEVEKSQETKMLNAYVTGMGQTKRIVLWDTLLQKMTPEQTLFVMGHEMGHYVLHHIWLILIYGTFLLFFLFYLVYRSAHFLLRRFSSCFGFTELANIASFPLLLFLFSAFSLLSDPLTNYFSRYLEKEADRFGLDLTENNQAAGEAFVILQEENLANPRPSAFYTFWRASHPSLQERVDFANDYCPYNRKSSPK